ncbi:phosphotransferase [Lentzea sp. NPDC034063]|uniref:phosphotransferase family protein n=1 Tax=unclassified Lentzea TaxID=2643253 RepID=UPI0033D09835
MSRTVTALVSAPGGFAGRLDAFEVPTLDWYHVEPVNDALERLLGVPTHVLRLISAEGGDRPCGGFVTYHVEALGEPGGAKLHAAEEPEQDAEHRMPWARRGGPSELVAWADTQVGRTGPAVQVRTWAMSVVHRLPTADGPVWLKAVPPFFSDEGAVIEMVADVDPTLVPKLIASAPQRVLLGDEPGGNCWDVTPEDVETIVPRWVAVQHALAGEPRIRSTAVPMPGFGLPDTLTHGDFHPGNWHRTGAIIDWADAVWGHPALDACRIIEFTRPEIHDHVRRVWSEAWLALRPDSRPLEALDVARAASHLHNAVKAQQFLDNVEQSERIYHTGYPEAELRAVRLPVR